MMDRVINNMRNFSFLILALIGSYNFTLKKASFITIQFHNDLTIIYAMKYTILFDHDK